MVAFWSVQFLPPMKEWQSGLLPYPVLLICQFLIIALYCKIALDFTHQSGYFVLPSARLGRGLLIFGGIYLGGMIARYIIRMAWYPDQRWFGGIIPIFFHWILASFILLVGTYHRRQTD
ncbi:MAG: rane protein of unknown function [Acidobacteriales bacterium]|nr:rane protein of unknown function [Terriglobales bacterium]